MSRPTRLADLLERWQPAQGSDRLDPASAIATSWADAVGAEIARRTRPGKVRDGVLTVYTAGSTWSHQLTFFAPTMLAALVHGCPDCGVRRLRFVVATGRTKALLDGLAGASAERAKRDGPSARAKAASAPEHGDDPASLVHALRRRQRALDRDRLREGWVRCPGCAAWREPREHSRAACAVCASERQRAADGRIERVLTNAPWLRAHEVAAHLSGVAAKAYARVRVRLLARWEEQLSNARLRLRRGQLTAADRVVAWSYLMLRCAVPRESIGRA
ncbi:MAG TPA: DUF721 domain-containing protein, partial [Candidatus Eremiobacteraceae bacterium]|nr:DUF721 domain-containing protein [Candidatus Eremiobacteraceae bacterium]